MKKYIKGIHKREIFRSDKGYVIGIFKVKDTNDEELEIYVNKTITFTGYFADLKIDDNYVFGFTAGQTNTVTVNFTPEYATNLALTWKLSQNHYFTLNTNTGDPHTIEVTAKDESILGGATMVQETLTATAESGTNVKFTLIFNKA